MLVCIPAVFYLEARDLPEWPVHLSQFASVLVCAVASIVYLCSRAAVTDRSRIWVWLAWVAMLAGILWLLFGLFVVSTVG